MTNAAPTPRAVALVLVPALVLMLAFAFSYVGAFHDPTPHAVPVGGGEAETIAYVVRASPWSLTYRYGDSNPGFRTENPAS